MSFFSFREVAFFAVFLAAARCCEECDKGPASISGQALIWFEMSVDKGSRVAGLAGLRAPTSRCAEPAIAFPVAVGAEHVHTRQPVKHFTATVPV